MPGKSKNIFAAVGLARAFLGTVLFYATLAVTTPFFSLVAILITPLPPLMRFRIIAVWSFITIFSLRIFCGVKWKVVGANNIPAAPAVFLSRHESAWETIAYQHILPPQSFVLKKQLLQIPFFGWGLARMSPIAINRANKRQALLDIRQQGMQRLAAGFSVVIFPEGTRLSPEARRPYQSGGAWLAKEAEVPAVPIAVNSGKNWPPNQFIKTPGTITVAIGAPINTKNLEVNQINTTAKTWTEKTLAGKN